MHRIIRRNEGHAKFVEFWSRFRGWSEMRPSKDGSFVGAQNSTEKRWNNNNNTNNTNNDEKKKEAGSVVVFVLQRMHPW